MVVKQITGVEAVEHYFALNPPTYIPINTMNEQTQMQDVSERY